MLRAGEAVDSRTLPLTPEKTNATQTGIDERWDREFPCRGQHSLKGTPLGKIEPIHIVEMLTI